MSKLWQKENITSTDDINAIEKFTIGSDHIFDMRLAIYDIQATIAHCEMLETIDLLTNDELTKIKASLKEIADSVNDDTFRIDAGVEDVHSQIEFTLTRKLGEIGKKIHSGRSRNDQVLTAIKLYLRSELDEISDITRDLFYLLISLSEKHKSDYLPGYTHLQIAMPSSFGLWFAAYSESLVDDMEMVTAARKIVNKNPLGSAAGYGSSFPINRLLTTEKLGFESMNVNVVYAQMTRGKSEKAVATAIASIASTLSKLSYDVCLYMNQNMGFLSFPDAYTTGSSIMPHKKNPDVFELIRAKCNKIQNAPAQLTLLLNNLPSGYHRDLQITKECIFPEIDNLKECLRMTILMLKQIIVKKDILENVLYDQLFTVENVNKLVLNGIPFRDAYKMVGLEVENGKYEPLKQLNHTLHGGLGNLSNDLIVKAFENIFKSIKNY